MNGLAALGTGFLLCYGAACGAAHRCPPQVRVSLPNFEIAPYVLGTGEVESPPGLLPTRWRCASCRRRRK